MASLALLVCILVGFVVCVGPIAYFICSFSSVPNILVYIIGGLSIMVGIAWLSLPVPNVKYLGLIPIALGYFSIGKRLGKPKNNA